MGLMGHFIYCITHWRPKHLGLINAELAHPKNAELKMGKKNWTKKKKMGKKKFTTKKNG